MPTRIRLLALTLPHLLLTKDRFGTAAGLEEQGIPSAPLFKRIVRIFFDARLAAVAA